MPLAIVPSTAISGTGTTRRRYRRLLAEQLGRWIEATVTRVPTSGEGTRIVLSDALADDDAGYPYAWGDETWAYVRDGEQANSQRRVLGGPVADQLRPDGGLLLSRPLGGVVAIGDVVEATSPLPCEPVGGIKGLDTLIDEALERCWVEAQITLTGTGTDSYDLAPYPYLELPAHQLAGLSDQRWTSSTDAPRRSPGRAIIRTDGGSRTLVTEGRYGASDTFTLDVVVKADHLVRDPATGTWSYPATPGLAGEGWSAAAPERWVTTLGMTKALEYLITRIGGSDSLISDDVRSRRLSVLDRRYRTAAAAARSIRAYEMPKTRGNRVVPHVSVAV